MLLELTGKNFDAEVLQASLPVLVLWMTASDPNCTRIALDMMKLDPAKVKICKIDMDKSPELIMRFSIRQIPLLMVFIQGMVIAQDTSLTPSVLQNIQ